MNNHPLSFKHYEPFFIPLSWENIWNLYCRLNYCIMWVMLFGYCEVCKIKIIMSYKKQNCSNWMDLVFCFLETNILTFYKQFFLVGMSGSSYPSNTLIFLAMHKCVLQSGMCMVQGKPSQLVEQRCRFLVNMGKFTVSHYLGRGRWNGWLCRHKSEKEAGFGPDGIIWSEFQTSTFPKFSWWFTCFYQFNIVNQLM